MHVIPGVFDYVRNPTPDMPKKRNRRRLIFALVFLSLSTVLVFIYLFLSAEEPPVESINKSQAAISAAKEADAEQYAPDLLDKAEKAHQQALDEWQRQNELLSFNRKFGQMRKLAQEATETSVLAGERAAHVKDSLHTNLKNKLENVKHKIDHFESYYAHLPLKNTTRRNFTTAKMRYTESGEAFARGAYHDVGLNLDVASKLISKSVQEAHSFLSDYFDDLDKWKRWADETIKWTQKNNSTAIIVDKFAHKCYVYRNGKIKKEFTAEMGPNWIGTKQHRGDKATPEGKYHVTVKKAGRQTKYYKALLINYPNEEDKDRYQKNVRNGNIPKVGIGNLIEIHGDGGKGINWTDGCVALTNKEMDELYDMVRVGTPVTIVGSLRSLKEINGI
jgi:L,D-peptidoglycan transpeptidase YkuD (ErfK/YbiS/YcfS/YnhG family)